MDLLTLELQVLWNMDGKDKKNNPLGFEPAKVKVSGKDLTQLMSYLQGLQVGTTSYEASSSREFKLSSIAKSRTGTQKLQRPSTKVLNEESMKYWTALGGPF